jgi:hypothetical protein
MGKKKDEAATADDAAPAKKVTQREAVTKALAAGKELPPDGVKFVKDTFGMELSNQAFSTLKSQIKKAGGATPSGRGRKPGRPAASANSAQAGGISSSGKTPNPAELARGIKQLVATYGAVAVSDMLAVMTE